MSRDQAKTRENRIFRRGSEAIRQAFEEGRITARRADILIHSDPIEAEVELAAILTKQERVARRSKVAAEVIRSHLQAGHRDLARLATDLRLALHDSQTIG